MSWLFPVTLHRSGAPAHPTMLRFLLYGSLSICFLLAGLAACDGYEAERQSPPTLSVTDQFLVNSRLNVRSVTLDRPGWIVIRYDSPEGVSQVIGKAYVEAGQRWSVRVDIEEGFAEDFTYRDVSRARAVLHYDTGTEGVYEFDGAGTPDPPVMLKGEAVGQPFRIYHTTAIPESYILVTNQEIEAGTILIEEIKMSEPGDVVIHRDKGNAPLVPGIIGKTALEEGLHRNVEVKLFDGARVRCREKLWPMLHVRTTSDNQPYDLDQPIITESFIKSCD